MVKAIGRELELQQSYLEGEPVNTIYFGGGTPSLLSEAELGFLLGCLHQVFSIKAGVEITLEANPDDLQADTLRMFQKAGINRLSIGIQSFHEPHLRYLNRAHNAGEARSCLQRAQDLGFDNISIDLIYAIPAPDHQIWMKDLTIAVALKPQHIAAYCLTIEEKTAFGQWLKNGKIKEVADEYAAEQFEILLSTLNDNGYEQYEISNFCIPDYESRHNSNYWLKEKYLGVGPGAHSYNGNRRQYNISNNGLYLKALGNSRLPAELDELQPHDQANEYIMTGLRTKWGIDLGKIKKEYGFDLHHSHRNYLKNLLKEQKILMQGQRIILTNRGKLLADRISSDLFILDE